MYFLVCISVLILTEDATGVLVMGLEDPWMASANDMSQWKNTGNCLKGWLSNNGIAPHLFHYP